MRVDISLAFSASAMYRNLAVKHESGDESAKKEVSFINCDSCKYTQESLQMNACMHMSIKRTAHRERQLMNIHT